MIKTYVVTGGAGFIGSHIVDALIARGDRVIVLDDLSNGFRENVNPKAQLHIVDIRNSNILDSFIPAGVDGLFHCAAIVSVQYSLEHPKDTADINIQGTKNILEIAVRKGIRRVVFSSSAAVYGETSDKAVSESLQPHPENPYGMQKLTGEKECAQYTETSGLETVILRYFNVYGSRQRGDSSYSGVIAAFAKKRIVNQPLTIFGDGSQTRDFIHVSDIVLANLAAMDTVSATGKVFNVGSGIATSVKEVADIIGGDIVYAPARTEVKNSLADISKIQKSLNWSPRTNLKKGISDLL